MKTFTIEEILNYLKTQDSLGDIFYNLSEENIEKANGIEEKRYRENWNPDWQGDPDDPLRWKGW